MSNQAQCPNCGGYKLTSQKISLTKEVPITSFTQRLPLMIPGLIVMAIGLAMGFAGDFSGDSGTCGNVLALVGFTLMLPVLGVKNLNQKIGDGYRFDCLLCGYRWEWREGQPWPKVNVNPDLIAKGASRLEQEAAAKEEERKRQEDLYHLSKLGKK